MGKRRCSVIFVHCRQERVFDVCCVTARSWLPSERVIYVHMVNILVFCLFFFFCCFLCSLHLAVYAASCRSTFIRSRLSCAFLWSSSSSSWLLRRVFSSVFSCSTAFLFLRLLRLAADDQLLALIVHALIFCVRWDFLFSSAEVGYGLPFNKKLATKKKKKKSNSSQQQQAAS